MRTWIAVGMALLLTVQLAGCSTTDSKSGDNTGDLGSPRQSSSPGNVFVALGTAYLQDGRAREALVNARKAAELDPNLSSAQNLLGVIYMRLGNRDRAGEHFRKAVQLSPHDPYALNALGTFVCADGKYAEAIGYFRRALRNPLYPTPWVALFNSGQCSEQAGQAGQAEEDYRKALQYNPEFAAALIRMAHISFDKGNYLSARAYLERYAQAAKPTADSLMLGVRTETQLGDTEQAAKYSRMLRVSFPDSKQAQFLDEEVGKP